MVVLMGFMSKFRYYVNINLVGPLPPQKAIIINIVSTEAKVIFAMDFLFLFVFLLYKIYCFEIIECKFFFLIAYTI